MPRDSRQTNPPALQVNKEKDVVGYQAAPRQHFDREEIDTRHHGHVASNELLPGCILAALGCRSETMPSEHVSDGLVRNVVAQIRQGTDNPVVPGVKKFDS